MRLESYLKEKKEILMIRKMRKGAYLCKYACKGNLRYKKINGKRYPYFQYRDDSGATVSAYLSGIIAQKFAESMSKAKTIKKRIDDIDDELKLLENVRVNKEECAKKVLLPNAFQQYHILDGAFGVSKENHIAYYVSWEEESGSYIAIFSYRRKQYRIRLPRLCETDLHRIKGIMDAVSYRVDKQIYDDHPWLLDRYGSLDGYIGRTGHGRKYACTQDGDHYLLTFMYKKKKHSCTYVPQTRYSSKTRLFNYLEMGYIVDAFCDDIAFDDTVNLYMKKKASAKNGGKHAEFSAQT